MPTTRRPTSPQRRTSAPRTFALGVAGLLCLAGTSSGSGVGGEKSPFRPNVLLIVMDTARADHLSCYGYPEKTTPGLDRLASQGTLFEQVISAGSWTLPSHATIFTGLYLHDHKTTAENWNLAPEFTTLAEVLLAAGYDTAGFSCNPWLGKGTGLTQGFRTFLDLWRDPRPRRQGDDGAELATQYLLDWIDSAATGRPFFAFVNFMEPHLPYDPPAGFESDFVPKDADAGELAELRGWKHPREVGYILHVPGYEVSDHQFRLLRALYDGEIAYLDSKIDELIRGLAERNVLEDTLLIITSDHGEHIGDHGLMDHKMSLYEALIHVPLIVRYPRAVPQGVRIHGPVQTNDLFPTVLRLCGIERPAPSGSAPLPFDNDTATRELTFAEFGPPTEFLRILRRRFPEAPYARFDRSLVAVRGPRYKYIWASDGRSELYDIADDPDETREVSATFPNVTREMAERVRAFRADVP